MKGQISVIVPVYNVEVYLKECVDSIINQTYKNLEIILVDDGSPDKCGEICDRYAELDQRIKVIHKENGGLSQSRNRGLDAASGEFVSFVDSDDVLDPKMYETLAGLINKHGTDIAMCGYTEFSESYGYESETDIDDKEIVKYSEKGFAECLLKDFYLPYIYVWNKLYRREKIGKIRFPEGLICEDSYFISDLIVNGLSCVETDAQLYKYRCKRSGSITFKRDVYLLKNIIDSKLYSYKVVRDVYDRDYAGKLFCKTLNRCSRHVAEVYWYIDRSAVEGLREEWCAVYDRDKGLISHKKEMIKLGLFRYFPNIYYAIMKRKVKVI